MGTPLSPSNSLGVNARNKKSMGDISEGSCKRPYPSADGEDVGRDLFDVNHDRAAREKIFRRSLPELNKSKK